MCSRTWIGTAFALFLLVVPALAVYPPKVKDDAKYFDAKTLEMANAKIREIYKKYHKDVVVETITGPTADQTKDLDKEGPNKFWPKLALKRIDELGVRGIYLVISKKPAHVRIEMDPDTRKKPYTNADRSRTLSIFVEAAKSERMDEALLNALESIEKALKDNAK